ncbi:MAG: exopolysaccharide biosynthesis protein [bacterium]
MATHPEIEPLSAILSETIADEVVTLGELVDRLAQRGFGVVMIVLALPTLFPLLPPGSAAAIGLVYVLLSVQMLIGLGQPWLPQRARKVRLSARAVTALRQRGVPFLRRIERWSRPRPLLLDDRIITRAVALAVFVLGAILFFPLPFLNTIPALAVLVLGIGLLNRDAVFLLIGSLMTVGVLLVIRFGLGTLIALFNHLLDR